jgi:hypothetical protein
MTRFGLILSPALLRDDNPEKLTDGPFFLLNPYIYALSLNICGIDQRYSQSRTL